MASKTHLRKLPVWLTFAYELISTFFCQPQISILGSLFHLLRVCGARRLCLFANVRKSRTESRFEAPNERGTSLMYKSCNYARQLSYQSSDDRSAPPPQPPDAGERSSIRVSTPSGASAPYRCNHLFASRTSQSPYCSFYNWG